MPSRAVLDGRPRSPGRRRRRSGRPSRSSSRCDEQIARRACSGASTAICAQQRLGRRRPGHRPGAKPQAASSAERAAASRKVRRSDDDIDDPARHDDQLLRRAAVQRLCTASMRQRHLFNLFLGHVRGHRRSRPRRLPLIWIGRVTVSSTSIASSATGQGASAISPSPPSMRQISSARCGVIGDISCASVRIAWRFAPGARLGFREGVGEGVEPRDRGVEAEALDAHASRRGWSCASRAAAPRRRRRRRRCVAMLASARCARRGPGAVTRPRRPAAVHSTSRSGGLSDSTNQRAVSAPYWLDDVHRIDDVLLGLRHLGRGDDLDRSPSPSGQPCRRAHLLGQVIDRAARRRRGSGRSRASPCLG